MSASAALTLVVSVWAARRADGLEVLVSIVDVGALAAFSLLHASVIGFFVVRHRQPARLAHWIVPLLGGIVTIWVIAESGPMAKAVGFAWLILGILVMAVKRR